VLAITITASTFLIGTFLPDTEWVTPSQARLWTCLGFAILLVGLALAAYLWRKSKKYEVTEIRQLIHSIPDLMGSIHEKRGLFTEEYVHNAIQSNELKPFEGLNRELYQILGGRLPDDIEKDNNMVTLLVEIMEFIIKKPTKHLTDDETARLVANSIKTHLPIETMLGGDKEYQDLTKSLKNAMNKLPKAMAVKATEAINYYLLYSSAYWAIAANLLSIERLTEGNEAIKDIVSNAVGMEIDINAMLKTAYNIYKDKFQEQMNINMAKVCEVINEYYL